MATYEVDGVAEIIDRLNRGDHKRPAATALYLWASDIGRHVSDDVADFLYKYVSKRTDEAVVDQAG